MFCLSLLHELHFGVTGESRKGLPWRLSGKNLPANAGDTFGPWSAKTPRPPEQLILAPQLFEPVLESPGTKPKPVCPRA